MTAALDARQRIVEIEHALSKSFPCLATAPARGMACNSMIDVRAATTGKARRGHA